MPKKKRGSRPPENIQKNVQQSNQRRTFLLLGGGAIAAAGVGFAGYRAGWFESTKPNVEPPKPSIARKLPPVTLEPNYENALRSVNELTEYYARAIDNPYVLIHAVRGFGRNFTRTDGSNAVNRLCTAYAADKEVGGKRYVYFERINEVHDNSFLKTFLEAGVSTDQKLSVSGREYSLVDLGNSAKALFRFDPQNLKRFDPELTINHLPWGVIAFSILMTPEQSTWTNAYGETIALNTVIDRGLADYEAVTAKTAEQLALGQKEPEEFFKEIRTYSCYGLHSMYGFLSCLRHGYREHNLEQRIRQQFDVVTYRLKGDADALEYTYDTEGKGAPPIAVEGLKLRSFVQLLGHCFESINYVRLHKLFEITPSQERRIAEGEKRLYEYLVRWRAMDIAALERTVDSMIGRGQGVKFMSDLVIALGHAARALKLLTPNNPVSGPDLGQMMRRYVFWLTLLVTFFPAFTIGQEAPGDLRPRALPLYEQCSSLGNLPAKTRTVTSALARLKSDDVATRIGAASELGSSCDRRATAGLVKAMRDDKDPLVRAAAVQALGRLGDRDSIDALQEAISDSDSRVTAELGRTLCSFQVYKPSYAALNFLANPSGRPIVDEGDAYARCQAILSIFQLRDVGFSRKGMLFLFGMSNSDDAEIQRTAKEAIRESAKTRNGAHELTGTLKQANNPDFRAKAAYWIGELKVEAGRDLLTEIAETDRVVNVRAEAATALKKLGPAKE